jgi:pilus assembly protein Flp/PilA
MESEMHFVAAWAYLQERCSRDEHGASLVEYVLLVALIAVVAIGAMTFLGTDTSTKLTSVGNVISSAS